MTTAKNILNGNIGINYESNLKKLSAQFHKDGYVRIENFLDESFFKHILDEITNMRGNSFKRDFVMEEYNSPRKLSVLGAESIKRLNPTLLELYDNEYVRNFVKNVVKNELYSCQHPEEYFVINYLSGLNSTHGWHLDDPEYALVLFIQSPATSEVGGLLEFIPFYNKNVSDLQIKECIVNQEYHPPNTAYILYASKNLHRVTPLTAEDEKRTVINMGFDASRKDVSDYGVTATKLYADIGW